MVFYFLYFGIPKILLKKQKRGKAIKMYIHYHKTFILYPKKNMKIHLTRLDKAFHMQASNEAGNTVTSDGAESIGGSGQGMRPMEMLISSLGSCSAIDVIQFLKKMRQPLEHIELEIDAERDPDNVPSLFTRINLHYTLKGDLDPKKTEKAISLSVDKYCSVARILEKTAEISWSYTLI